MTFAQWKASFSGLSESSPEGNGSTYADWQRILELLGSEGVETVDLSDTLCEKGNFYENEVHPNGAAHAAIARKIVERLMEMKVRPRP